MVSLWVCDEMCGTGRGSLAQVLQRPRVLQVVTTGRAKDKSLAPVQDCLYCRRPWNGAGAAELRSCRNAELWQHLHVLAPWVTELRRRSHPQKPPKGGKGSDDAPSSQELNNGAREPEHGFAWPGDPVLCHQHRVWDRGCTSPGTPGPLDSVCLHSVFQAFYSF